MRSSSYRRSLLLDPPSTRSYRRSLLLDPPSTPKVKDWSRWEEIFYLLEFSCKSRWATWDPWPVENFRPNTLFRAAEDIIRQRNEASVDNFVNKIVLLPACNNIAGRYGGTADTDLCSIRSPSKLPMRFHLWRTHNGTIMVRKGLQSMKLTKFIETFDVTPSAGSCPFYHFWRSLETDEKYLNELKVPNHLKDAFRQRWRSINVFPFLDLPAELREMVMSFAIGHYAEPSTHVYRPAGCLPGHSGCCANLLLVNKQLRREAMPIFLSQVTFSFRKHGQLMRFLEQTPKSILQRIQSLELCFDHDTLLDFFGAQVFLNSPTPGNSSSDDYVKDSLFTDRLKLRHLCIYFPHPEAHMDSRHLWEACQKTVCLWIWAAARRCLRDIPEVSFQGFIKHSQKKEWLEIHSLERRGVLPDPHEFKRWQTQVWREE